MTTHTPGRTIGPFKFTDVDDDVIEGSGTRFHFTYQGKQFVAEEWHARNADGLDIYTLDGEPVTDTFLDEDDEEVWEEAIEEMGERWQDAYDRIIRHAQEQAVQRTLFMEPKPVPYVRPEGI